MEKSNISKKCRRNITGFEEGTVEEKKPREGRSPRNLEAPWPEEEEEGAMARNPRKEQERKMISQICAKREKPEW